MAGSIPRRTTTPCHATVRLEGGNPLDVTFWLLPDPHREKGVTPMRVLLEENRRFFPVGLPGGGSCLLSRDALVTVSIEAQGPGADPGPVEGTSVDLVTLHLVTGEELSGVLESTAVDGHERMSDVFNVAGRFVAVAVGAQVVFVATSRVARVTF